MEQLQLEVRKAYNELPKGKKNSNIEGEFEGVKYIARKNNRFIAIGLGRAYGTWCVGDSITDIEQRLGGVGSLKGFIVWGADKLCPLWCNEFGCVGTVGEENKDVNLYIAYDNRYKTDKKKCPVEEILLNNDEHQNSGHLIVFENDGVENHCNKAS